MADLVDNWIKMNKANKKRFRELYGVADESAEFSFEMVIPSPKTEAECPSRYKQPSHCVEQPACPWFNWYDWNVDHWGVKWDAGEDVGAVGDLTSTKGLRFDTVWGPPIPVYKKMAQDGLEFTFRWYGPRTDIDCGCGEAKGGEIRIAFDLARLVEMTARTNVGLLQLGKPEWWHWDFMDEFGNFGEFDGTSFMVRTTGFGARKHTAIRCNWLSVTMTPRRGTSKKFRLPTPIGGTKTTRMRLARRIMTTSSFRTTKGMFSSCSTNTAAASRGSRISTTASRTGTEMSSIPFRQATFRVACP